MDELEQVLSRVAPRATEIRVRRGKYLCWAPGSGEELWLQVNRRKQVFAVNPHFAGSSRVHVGLVELIQEPEYSALGGAFRAWTDPEEKPDRGVCEIALHCPNAACHTALKLPVIATAQIAAFANSIEVDDSAEVVGRAAEAAELPSTSRSLAPPGVFAGGATAETIFSGRVIESSMRENSLTGDRYVWAAVQTFGGAYDVVADPTLLSAPPAPGAVVTGSFLLSGRLLEQPPPPEERKGLLRRLFD